MPFIEIGKPPRPQCRDREHNPPSLICLPDGVHVWQCPTCGAKQVVRVTSPTMSTSRFDGEGGK